MATLEDVKARQTAIQFCVQTVMISNDLFKHLKSTDIYSGISKSNMVDLEMRVGTESTQHGRKPFMNVRNVLSADEIAFSVLTFVVRAERN